jgi:Carboxypeptidase regulatory-like domain/TonB-dependent Receptor Plug Domain
VRLTNTSTNVSRETVSASEGTFRLDAVDPGTYKVEVRASGFKVAERDNVIIAAAQITDTSFTLEVGGADEVVNVSPDSSVILQKQDGARTSTLDPRQIVDLPIAGLNPANLVFTLPGVIAPGVLAGGFVQGTEFSINGLRPRANNQLIDGTDNNDNAITGQFYQPVLRDGYREVSVLGANNSAEYGRAGGAVVNVITRSGTNQFHGSVYDVITSSALSSLSNGQKANEGLTSVPVSIENDYGFSFGGPIKKDRLGSNPFDRSVDRSVASFDVPHRAVWSFIWDVPGPARGLLGEVVDGWTLSGIYRIQSGAVESPFLGGVDLNADLNSFNDRPTISNPNAPPTSVAFANSVLGFPGSGFVDINGNPVDPANTRFLVDPANRRNIAGRNTLRADRVNSFDGSVNKAFKLPFEGGRLEVRIEFFNLFNHPNFTFADANVSSDLSNGDVTRCTAGPFINSIGTDD